MKQSAPFIKDSDIRINIADKTRFIRGPQKAQSISSLQVNLSVFPTDAEIPKGNISRDKTEAPQDKYAAI